MTTRRIVSTEKTILDRDDDDLPPAQGIAGKGSTAPAVPSSVIYKLLAFSAAMIVLPIGTYFVGLNTVFRGSSTISGAAAAVVANIVLIGYVIAAVREDQSEQAAETKKDR